MQGLLEIWEAYEASFESFVPAFLFRIDANDVGSAEREHVIVAKDQKTQQEIKFAVSEASYLAVVDRLLRKKGQHPAYEYSAEFNNVLMVSIWHPAGHIEDLIGRQLIGRQLSNAGIVMFLNWQEPEEGTEPLNQVFPKPGDYLMLAYVIPKLG